MKIYYKIITIREENFMAECPKCHKKLKLTNVSQYCPGCGINIMYANFEPQFEKDRRTSEMSLAAFRVGLAKFKSNYVAGRLRKVKILLALLPVAALFIPLGKLDLSLPLYGESLSYNVLDLFYGAFFESGLFSRASQVANLPVFGELSAALKMLIIAYAIPSASAVIILLDELLCFIGNKKSSIIMFIFSVLGFVGSIFAGIEAGAVTKAAANFGELVTAESNIIFAVLAAILFIPAAVIAILALKHPAEYPVSNEDKLRMEYREKYRKGQIELLDIPAPIAETEEEKKEREKLIREAYHMADAGEESDNG